jgi:hypothetical protein
MSNPVDPELLDFAAQVIEKHGGVTEYQTRGYQSLLPPALAQQLELPEEFVLGSKKAPLMYGHPLLDRLIAMSTEQVPVLYARIAVPYLKRAGFEQLIASQFSFRQGKCRIISQEEARTNYAILYCRYLAMSDQRKEGLIEIAVHENTGAVVSNFENRLDEFEIEYLVEDQIPADFSANPHGAFNTGLNHARMHIEQELPDFLASIRRHLNRDVKNTREYYEALKKEMEESLQRTNLSPDQIKDRKSKIHDLPHEMERKITDLRQKYQVEITLTISGIIRFLVPVVQLSVELSHRKIRRNFFLRFNPVTYHLDPLVCEKCRRSIYAVHIVEKKGKPVFLCEACEGGSA